MKPSDFKLGQRLWHVPAQRYDKTKNGEWHVVKRIGRKWVTAGLEDRDYTDRRFDPEDMYVDGGGYSPPGRYYLTKEEYDERVARNKVLHELREYVTYGTCERSCKLSSQRLREILNELKGEPQDTAPE